jgi:hexosaminidase
MNPKLLPYPRSLKILRGTFTLPEKTAALILGSTRAAHAVFHALTEPTDMAVIRATKIAPDGASAATREGARAPQSDLYTLKISKRGIEISFPENSGLRAATATLRQLLRQYGRHLPCLKIRDWPDFARRGVMLDTSRGRVPKLETLLDLVERLADFKINELQLYTEHTFAYRNYKSVWHNWGALTANEIQTLDARCRELGIDLVPNQNSFGHLREFLARPALNKLGEMSAPYESETKDFLRRPTTLAPNHPGTLPFLRGLYDELLPNFSSRCFNVGCDETWDLGRGRSKELCKIKGKGRVYLDFLKQIHREVSVRGKAMMFWGDIILKYPGLITELAVFGVPPSGSSRRPPEGGTPSLIALNWGYEANHPFATEAAQFAKAKILFYVCPGTSSWQTLVGRHDNALANLRAAAKAGTKSGALGYLVTDWGDGGHPQPLAVSWPMFVAGAALAWNAKGFDERNLVSVLGRDIFGDDSVAKAAFRLGFVHQKLGVSAPNETPLGTVIAAPPLRERELFCRNGLKWFARIPAARIRAALKEIEQQRAILRSAGLRTGGNRTHSSTSRSGDRRSIRELYLAARMAAQSCKFMLWQQAVAAGKISNAKRLALIGIHELNKLEQDFNALWPLRNKATPKHCSAFLRWRMDDYRRGFVV